MQDPLVRDEARLLGAPSISGSWSLNNPQPSTSPGAPLGGTHMNRRPQLLLQADSSVEPA